MMSILEEFKHLTLTKSTFLWSLFFMFFNPLFWNTIARLEYKTHFLTKLFGDARRGCYALAASIFGLGLYRDYLFTMAVKEQPTTTLFNPIIVKYVAPSLIFMGNLFVLTSAYRLGITGTFLGDYFGILMDHRVTNFPFNVSEHPMYEGSTMIFLGYSLWNKSLAGLLLTVTIALVYSVASTFEGRFTTMIYAKRKPKTA